MDNFTPVLSTIGGLLIGASAALLMLTHGRIAGISGILSGLLDPRPGELGWRTSFTAGLLATGVVAALVYGPAFAAGVERSSVAIVAAGLLVGFGTRLGSGCTSGHGVCGIPRFSRRSILATLTFMAAGIVTATVVTQLFGGSI